MLAAEIYGKISLNNPPYQRMEDVLTSHVFSLFRYLKNLQLPTSFLREALNLRGEKLILNDLVSAQVCFWPRFSFPCIGFREPDALLLLEDISNGKVAAVIEAKYGSGLSNRGNNENDAEEDKEPSESFHYGHQLADEYCGVMCGLCNSGEEVQKELAQVNRKVLIFVTAHYEIPITDLEEAVDTIRKRAKSKCTGKGIDCWKSCKTAIYWVGWRNLYTLINQHLVDYTGGELSYIKDLQEALELRNLQPFKKPFNNLFDVDEYERLFSNTPPKQYETRFWLHLIEPGKYDQLF